MFTVLSSVLPILSAGQIKQASLQMIGTACQALSEQACLSRGLERALVLLTRLLHTLPNLVTVLVANTSDSFLPQPS